MSVERYTVVFTGLLSLKEPGEYGYLKMDSTGKGTWGRGRPVCETLGRGVSFRDLPEECRKRVLAAYRRLWDL